jgi:hypothetical protein
MEFSTTAGKELKPDGLGLRGVPDSDGGHGGPVKWSIGSELGYDRLSWPIGMKAGPMERERRRVPRFQFIAPAELVHETSGARINSWVADLGPQGCSLSIADAPREGSTVRLKIGTNPREFFQARAVVVHSSRDRVGLSFSEVKSASSVLLQKWLAAAKFPT